MFFFEKEEHTYYNNETSESVSFDCKTPSAILLKAQKPPFFIQISLDIQMKKKGLENGARKKVQIMKSTSIKAFFCSPNDKEKIGAKAYRMHFLCKNTGEQ